MPPGGRGLRPDTLAHGSEDRRTVVRETRAGRVRVEDVAVVRRGHQDREIIARSGGGEVVELALHREGSANTVAVSRAIVDEVNALREEMPPDLRLTVLTDQARYISDAIGQVWSAAVVGGIIGGRFALKTKPRHLKTIFACTNWLAALFMAYNAFHGAHVI